ncbi:hypothetical protein OEZ85_012747 [Tetradesmus obliquus]|uniref:Peptidase M11 gametolysin domain-containing protein n=1 Tax=Tetradesmus obliquus TaxID=3088 RepID=A0ABY8U3I9_TETOB|nr:hypothetical protein OEZ85_012747 [Tetradesmus obliquus]
MQAPSLFAPVAAAEASIAAYAVDLPREVDVVVGQSTSGRSRPSLQVALVDKALLLSSPPALKLTLSGVAQELQAVQRSDLSNGAPATGEVSAASIQKPFSWIGEVAGLPGGMSSVVLLLDKQSNTVHGHIRFWDSDRQGFRAFKLDFSESGKSPDDVLKFMTMDPTIAAWRDELGADLVTMFTGLDKNVVKECGRGWIGGGQKYAMSIICRGCYDGYTMAHELGHNQGCHHNYNDQDVKTYKGFMAGDFAFGWRR